METDKVALLSHCPLFVRLSQWELKSISRLMRLVEYKKDEIVYKEGGEAGSFYVIVSGRFEVFVSAPEKKKVLAYLQRGDHFGEMSLLTNQPHSATLRALSDSMVLELKKDDFHKTVESNPSVSLELSRRLSARLKVHDSRGRSLFKSDVISIFGGQRHVGRTSFSINFAASLVQETHQKTVLLDMSPSGTEIAARLQMPNRVPLTQFRDIENQPPETVSNFVVRHPVGFDVLNVAHSKDADDRVLIRLLNFLAIDYRFIVIDLPAGLDELVFKILTQSDAVFFITDSHLNNITETKDTIADLEKNMTFPENKIAVVVNEALFGIQTSAILKKEFIGKRCFTLPPAPAAGHVGEKSLPFVVDDPDAEYSRIVRHIARYASNNLVGLALGSGAALGLAHIGVLKVLERERIPIDIIAGSSIGALIGALYSISKSAAMVEQCALEINLSLLLTRLVDINLLPVRSLLHGKAIMKHFSRQLSQKTFDHCKIPLKIVAANLSTRQVQVIESGLLSEAVRTSIAVPAVFKPVLTSGDLVVDGGILSPLPIRALHQAGANKVIAVNVFPSSKDAMEKRIIMQEVVEKARTAARQKGPLAYAWWRSKRFVASRFTPNIFDILMNTIQSMESEIADIEGQAADVLIRPVVPNATWMELYKPRQFIEKGEEETMKLIQNIKSLVSQQNI